MLREADSIPTQAPTDGRVLALSELYPPTRGGHVVWLHEVCRRLPDALVCTGGGPAGGRMDAVDGVATLRVDLSRKWYFRPESLAMYFRLYRAGLRLARRYRPRAILAARALPEGLVANAIRRRTGIPTIAFAHGEEINRALPGLPLPRRNALLVRQKRRLLWSTYRQLDGIIANSQFTSELLTGNGIRAERVRMIHPGTDPGRFTPASADADLARRWDVEGRQVILSVGRLTTRKGQDKTIEALPRVLEAAPDAVYLIAGTGERADALAQQAGRLGVSDHVRFLGEVEADELPALYQLADVFIMASRQLEGSQDVEGFGIVFLEAAASGVPTIAGRCGGTPDAVEHQRTGLLVDGACSDPIAEALIDLLTHPQRSAEMGRQGRRRVWEQFTWERSADRVAEWSDEVAGTRSLS